MDRIGVSEALATARSGVFLQDKLKQAQYLYWVGVNKTIKQKCILWKIAVGDIRSKKKVLMSYWVVDLLILLILVISVSLDKEIQTGLVAGVAAECC